jgi:hydroxymethylpyrimidine pyrophosphatase-like HAD family hydrolase
VCLQFCSTFYFTTQDLSQRKALLQIKEFIFHQQLKESKARVIYSYHWPVEKMKEEVHCWKVDVDNIDDKEPQGIQINKSEGEHALKGKRMKMTTPHYNGLIKTKKHNIGTKEAPKMAIIGDYWDKETITQVVDVLKEHEDLFPCRFLEMKGIVESQGAMKNQLKLDAKLVKRRPY